MTETLGFAGRCEDWERLVMVFQGKSASRRSDARQRLTDPVRCHRYNVGFLESSAEHAWVNYFWAWVLQHRVSWRTIEIPLHRIRLPAEM